MASNSPEWYKIEIDAAFRDCRSLGDAEGRLRGNLFGQLTVRCKRANTLLDEGNPTREELVHELRDLEFQKARSFYLNSLILANYEKSEDLKKERPAQYEKAKNFSGQYVDKWIRTRHRLYNKLAVLVPSPEVLEAADQSRPANADHSALYLPPGNRLEGQEVEKEDQSLLPPTLQADETVEEEEEEKEASTPEETGARQRTRQQAATNPDEIFYSPPPQQDPNALGANGAATTAATASTSTAANAQGMMDLLGQHGAAAPNAQLPQPNAQLPPPNAQVPMQAAFGQAGNMQSLPAATTTAAPISGAPMMPVFGHVGTTLHAPPAPALPNLRAPAPAVLPPAQGPLAAAFVPQPNSQVPPLPAQGPLAAAFVPPPNSQVLPPTAQGMNVASYAGAGVAPGLPPAGATHATANANAALGMQPSPSNYATTPYLPLRQPFATDGSGTGRDGNQSNNNAAYLPPASVNFATLTSSSQNVNTWQSPLSLQNDPVASVLQSVMNDGRGGGDHQGNFLAPGGPVGPINDADRAIGYTAASEEANNLLSSGGGPSLADEHRGSADMSIVRMYSQSLAANFNVNNIIKQKFGGDRSEFPNFILLWSKVHRLTLQYGFTPQEQFAILKQVLVPPALTFVKTLPPEANESYASSIRSLYEIFYDRKTNLTNVIQTLVETPPSNGSYEGRQRILAALHSYANSILALGADHATVRTAWEFHFTTQLLDFGWAKEWAKFYSKRKNLNNPLGADVTFSTFTTCLRDQFMQQMLNMQFTKDRAGGGAKGQGFSDSRFKGNKACAAAAAAAKMSAAKGNGCHNSSQKSADSTDVEAAAAAAKGTAAAAGGKPFKKKGKGGKMSNEVIVPCVFCRGETKHPYPLQCYRIREKKLSMSEIREIAKRENACRMCFSVDHGFRTCPSKMTCGVMEDGKKCQMTHYRAFHKNKSTGNFVAAASSDAPQK